MDKFSGGGAAGKQEVFTLNSFSFTSNFGTWSHGFRCAAAATLLLAVAGAQSQSPAQTPGATTATAPAPSTATASSAPAPAPADSRPPSPAPPASSTPATAPESAPWSVGEISFSGYLDGYYSYNANRPSNAANGQINDLYNFNDKTDQFNLSAADLTLNHDPDPVGVHLDLIVGRTNDIIHPAADRANANYLEQAYVSFKPPKTHGAEIDFGQFVTSAGAESIAAKDNWNYSRSLLFSLAIPYYHFGLRTQFPATKNWTGGVQVVNGWNEVTANNGGATVGLTSAYTRPRYCWDLNVYSGPQQVDSESGYRNLIDTTLLLTPSAKFNAYLNYDYGQNDTAAQSAPPGAKSAPVPASSAHWQGVAVAAHEQVTAGSALAGRYEYYSDAQGFTTGTAQDVQEVTGTYEYKWAQGVLTRAEVRHDWSNVDFFHKGTFERVRGQTTATVALIAFFGPKH